MTAIACTAIVCGSALLAWQMHLSRLPRLSDAGVADALRRLEELEKKYQTLAGAVAARTLR